MSRWVRNLSREGDSPAALGSLFQGPVALNQTITIFCCLPNPHLFSLQRSAKCSLLLLRAINWSKSSASVVTGAEENLKGRIWKSIVKWICLVYNESFQCLRCTLQESVNVLLWSSRKWAWGCSHRPVGGEAVWNPVIYRNAGKNRPRGTWKWRSDAVSEEEPGVCPWWPFPYYSLILVQMFGFSGTHVPSSGQCRLFKWPSLLAYSLLSFPFFLSKDSSLEKLKYMNRKINPVLWQIGNLQRLMSQREGLT